jgi:hypothetical protein
MLVDLLNADFQENPLPSPPPEPGPISLDSASKSPRLRRPRLPSYPGTSRPRLPKLQLPKAPGADSDGDHRWRAFERVHSQHSARQLEITQKLWDADEEFRRWKARTAHSQRQALAHSRWAATLLPCDEALSSDGHRFPTMTDCLVRKRLKRMDVRIEAAPRPPVYYWGA